MALLWREGEWWSNAFPLFSVRRAWDHKARAHTPSFLRIPHSPTWTLPLYAVNTSAVFPYNNFCFFVQFRVKNNSRNSSNERESKFSSRRRKRRVCKPDITCFGGCQSQTWSIWGIPKERKRRRTSVWSGGPDRHSPREVVVVVQATLLLVYLKCVNAWACPRHQQLLLQAGPLLQAWNSPVQDFSFSSRGLRASRALPSLLLHHEALVFLWPLNPLPKVSQPSDNSAKWNSIASDTQLAWIQAHSRLDYIRITSAVLNSRHTKNYFFPGCADTDWSSSSWRLQLSQKRVRLAK